MRKDLIFKTVVFHGGTLPGRIPAGSSYRFFQGGSSPSQERITSVGESPLTVWLFAQPRVKELWLGELGVGARAFYGLCVKDPVIENPNKKPGDIDVLICEEAHRGIAMECERIKVTALNPSDDKVNRLEITRHGVKQANAMRELGDSQGDVVK